MSFRLRRKESVENGVRRIASEEIAASLAEIAHREMPLDETIHEARKHCKRLRGLLRLVRPAFEETYRQENAWFRDAARELSSARDADILLETFDRLAAPERDERLAATLAPIRATLQRHRAERGESAGGLETRLERFADRMREAQRRVELWRLDAPGFEAVGAGVALNYRRGRRAMRIAYADPTPEHFHEWRKRAKYHWHHMRLLSGLWKQEMQVRRDAADYLADLLGFDHDLAVLRDLVECDEFQCGEDSARQLVELLDRRRGELQHTARSLGFRLFAEKPSRLIARLERYWHVWRKQGKTPEPGSEA